MDPHATAHHSNRRKFIQSIAAGAATIGLSSFDEISSPLESNTPTHFTEDPGAWVDRIKGKHKMVFDVTQPHEIYPFAWPRVFLMTNKATGALEQDCCAVVVLRHAAIPYAMTQGMWEKYKFGEVFKAMDPATSKPATRNPFWNPPPGAFMVPGIGEVEIGINQLMKSGVLFCVCQAAMTVYGNVVAGSMQLKANDVISDWTNNLIPGIQPVPSGVWALGRAQEKGCGYVFAG
jgi:intracellular sulfur oxidation DsrE/DsrF family protein